MAKKWEKVASTVWPVLVRMAKDSDICSYDDLARKIKTAEAKLTYRNIYNALAPIQKYCLDNGYPLITALVVRQVNGKLTIPGDGFAWRHGRRVEDWEEERDKVWKFKWDSILNPFAAVTLEQFVNFSPLLDGLVLKTLTRPSSFRVNVDGRNIFFTPQSTGKTRREAFKRDIEKYLDFYNEGYRRPKEYGDLRNPSYFLAIMAEYEKPQNEVFLMKTEGGGANVTSKKTEIESLTKARIGQGKFRRKLLAYWENSCSVTKVGNKLLLRASHIKPWKDADNSERLNKFNGLLLTPNLDALFDQGLITFDGNGKITVSKKITDENMRKLGVHHSMSLRKIDKKHQPFLAYHRDNIFSP